MLPGRRAARLGLLGTAAVLALLALPYAYTRPASVATYYGATTPGPVFVGLLVVITEIALLAGARGRTDPATAAGIAVSVSAVTTLLALRWALPAREVIGGTSVPAWFEYHPLAVVLATLLLLGAAGLFAKRTV